MGYLSLFLTHQTIANVVSQYYILSSLKWLVVWYIVFGWKIPLVLYPIKQQNIHVIRLGAIQTRFVSTSAVLSFIRSTGLRCVGVRRNGGNTEFALTRPGKGVARWTAGRVCEGLKLGENTMFFGSLVIATDFERNW